MRRGSEGGERANMMLRVLQPLTPAGGRSQRTKPLKERDAYAIVGLWLVYVLVGFGYLAYSSQLQSFLCFVSQ